jgi:glycosyltransferase involved in cell wall biosynthesis
LEELSKKEIQVISPVFNEEAVVEEFYLQLRSTLQSVEAQYDYKIMLVVDKSTDSTAEILVDLAKSDPHLQVILLSNRFGHQMSLLAGIDHSDADVVVMMDSDLQHPPAVILDLLEAYEDGFEVVTTIRKEPKDNSWLKRVSSNFFYKIMNKFSEIEISRGEADFRLMTRKAVNVFKRDIRERNQFIRGLVRWIGFRQTSVAFEPHERFGGNSKYSWSIMFQFATHGIVSFSKKPLQYAILVGTLLSFVAGLIATWSFVSYFLYAEVPSGWTSLSIMVSFFAGIQLLFLGIIGQYVGAIFDESKARPHYIVEDKYNL